MSTSAVSGYYHTFHYRTITNTALLISLVTKCFIRARKSKRQQLMIASSPGALDMLEKLSATGATSVTRRFKSSCVSLYNDNRILLNLCNVLPMVCRVTNEPVDCRPSRGTNKHAQDRKRCSLLDDNSTVTADYNSAHANYTVNYIRQLQNHDYIHMTTTTSYKSVLWFYCTLHLENYKSVSARNLNLSYKRGRRQSLNWGGGVAYSCM